MSSNGLNDFIREKMQQHRIPGVSVGIVRDGELVAASGYGLANVEWSIPATEDTVYAVASTTKPLTGTAVMMLVEAGQFSLNDWVTRLLPDLPPGWSGVTVRHCLSHTSGLPDVLQLAPSLPERPDSREELLHRLAALPFEFPPGEKISYNQTGYLLVEMLIERVSGKSYPEFIAERIFQPLGMSESCFRTSYVLYREVGRYFSTIVPKRAGLYARENGALLNMDYLYGHNIPPATAGLNSSVTDLAKFDAALYTEKLLKRASLEQLWTRTRLNSGDPVGYGLGWNIDSYRGHRYVGHQGGGYLSNLTRYLDDRLAVIVLTNLDSYDRGLAEGIADLYLPSHGQRSYATFPEAYIAEAGDLRNAFLFHAIRLWEHAERIRSGDLTELTPLLVLCEDRPTQRTLREQRRLILGLDVTPPVRTELLAVALTVGLHYLSRDLLVRLCREELEMLKGASIIEEWMEERETRTARNMLLRLLRERFGELPDSVVARVESEG